MNQPELSFDGFGINGPDKYRSRVATFTKGSGPKYGNLFAAAPELLAALENLLAECEDYIRADGGDDSDAVTAARATIAKARG